MMNGIYPGTFDPVTLGHMDVIETASRLFDKLFVAVLINPGKLPKFSLSERKEMIRIATREKQLKNIEILSSEKLAVEVAIEKEALFMVRGLRLNTDYEEELILSFNNKVLKKEVSTLLIPPVKEHIHISSTAARFLIDKGLDTSEYLPESVQEYLRRKE